MLWKHDTPHILNKFQSALDAVSTRSRDCLFIVFIFEKCQLLDFFAQLS